MSSYDEMINRQREIVNNYDGKLTVDKNDSRLASVENERNQAINNNNNTFNNLINNSNTSYNNMINSTQQYYDNLNTTMKEAYERQKEAQNAQTQATIDQINTQKERTERDYQREQRGAYSDYQNQINPYGVQAEQMASNGLNNTGYSESSRTSMYNAYQNRVATARQSLQDAMVDYNAQIVNAQNTNNTTLAELWSNTYMKIAENALAGFQYRNQLEQSRISTEQALTQNKISNENTLQSRYDDRYKTMLNQINQEISWKFEDYNNAKEMLRYDQELKAKERQFQEQMSYQRERDRIQDAQWQKEYNNKLQQYKSSSSSSGGGTTRTVSNNSKTVSQGSFTNGILNNQNGINDNARKLKDIINNSNSQANKDKAKQILDTQIARVTEDLDNGRVSREEALRAISMLEYKD